MKKETWFKSFLVLLPVLAVGLATTVNSVTIFDPTSGITTYASYFTSLDAGKLSMIAPLAGLLCIVAVCLSVWCVIRPGNAALVLLRWVSLGAALAAVLPIIIRGEIMIVPNVGVPLFMIGEWLLSGVMAKDQTEAQPAALEGQHKSGSKKKNSKKKKR